MKLNINFNKSLEKVINSYSPLAEWFEKNQETMAYFGFTTTTCVFPKNSFASLEVITLSRMASEAITCLQSPLPISMEEKAKNAALAIAKIYEETKDDLSIPARSQYYINIPVSQTKNNNGMIRLRKRKKSTP